MSTPDPAKCVQVIKLLQKKVEDLKVEKIKALESQDKLKNELSLLHKEYNDVLQEKESLSEVVKSNLKQNSPESENIKIAALERQNLILQKELADIKSVDYVGEFMKICNLKEVINQCKKTISNKNDQIALLQKQNTQSELVTKVDKLQQLLKKSKHVNQTYAHHIEALQDQLNSISITDNQETPVKTVSGDQDLSGLGHLNTSSFEDENQELKAKVQSLNENLQDVREELRKAQTIEDTLRANVSCLENENRILTNQNRLLSAADKSDFPMDSQMKIFYDDFNEERSEKEKQWKENQEIKGENTRLKQQLDKLTSELKRQHSEEHSRQMMSPEILQSPPPPYQNQLSQYDNRFHQRDLFNSPYPQTAPIVEPVSYTHHDPAMVARSMMYQTGYASGAGHGNAVRDVPQKKIGFAGSGPPARPPRPSSSHGQPTSINPSYQPLATAQPSRPPPSRQAYSQMSLTPHYLPNHPDAYQHQPNTNRLYGSSTIQADSASLCGVLERSQTSEKDQAGNEL